MDDVSDEVRALVMENTKLLQQAKDLSVPGLRPHQAQASWSVGAIEKANTGAPRTHSRTQPGA